MMESCQLLRFLFFFLLQDGRHVPTHPRHLLFYMTCKASHRFLGRPLEHAGSASIFVPPGPSALYGPTVSWLRTVHPLF